MDNKKNVNQPLSPRPPYPTAWRKGVKTYFRGNLAPAPIFWGGGWGWGQK